MNKHIFAKLSIPERWLKEKKPIISYFKIENFLFVKIESSLPKDALCQVWFEISSMDFRYFLPLEKGVVLYLKNMNPLYPRMICAKFDWNWPSGSGSKCEKFTTKTSTTTMTDNGQISIRKAHVSLRLRWAKSNNINAPTFIFLQENVSQSLQWI